MLFWYFVKETVKSKKPVKRLSGNDLVNPIPVSCTRTGKGITLIVRSIDNKTRLVITKRAIKEEGTNYIQHLRHNLATSIIGSFSPRTSSDLLSGETRGSNIERYASDPTLHRNPDNVFVASRVKQAKCHSGREMSRRRAHCAGINRVSSR